MIAIVQFPMTRLSEAWSWLQQQPIANFDDFGPKTPEDFGVEMHRRCAAGEQLYGVCNGDELTGIIGMAYLSSHAAALHGICFESRWHGTGIAMKGLRLAIQRTVYQGYRKISASYFADNLRVHHFLQKAGFIEEGYLHRQTVRQGKEIDMRLVAYLPVKGER